MRKALLFVNFFLLIGLSVQAQVSCSFTADTKRGCIPQPVLFKPLLPQGKVVQSYQWNFGDNTTSNDSLPLHIYTTRGVFTPSVTITFTDGTSCTFTLGHEIKIYDNPVAAINMPVDTALCDKTPLCMKDASTVGADGAPLAAWLWDFGDGSRAVGREPCHQFQNSGAYNVTLEATDTNGCRGIVTKNIKLRFYPKMNPEFFMEVKGACDSANVTFYNLTDSTDKFIKKIIWDYGDGNKDSCEVSDNSCWPQLWDSTRHTYNTTGPFTLRLILVNEIGCREMYEFKDAVDIIKLTLNPTIEPDTVSCFGNGGQALVRFSHPEIEGAQITWDFGDPFVTQVENEAFTWQTQHLYAMPFIYNVKVTIKDIGSGCGVSGTYCKSVAFAGPFAMINFPNEAARNDTVPPRPFPIDRWPNNVDSCKDTSIQYAVLDTVFVPGGNIIEYYCNADTLSKVVTDSITCIDGTTFVKYSITLKPDSVVGYDTTIVKQTLKTWKMGDPLPTEPVFTPATGNWNPQNMHDSDLFTCNPQNWVQFVNNTIKFRLHDAPDDFPPGSPDVCKNPSFGHASDSLLYFWDLGEGTNDTSTAASPNARARYSTEILPFHFYPKQGCYTVVLTAIDTIFGCTSNARTTINMASPDAGWDDALGIKHMTYEKQQALEGSGSRRGFMLEGENCTGKDQFLITNELLPNCGLQDYWIVFDSLNDRTIDTCNGRIIEDFMWVSKQELEQKKRWKYSIPGWKTLGVVVRNGDCYDTAWYHNYKYIYGVEADVTVLPDDTCAGDTVKIVIRQPEQQGLKFFIIEYYLREAPGMPTNLIASDTLPYVVYGTDTITSFFRDSLSGVWDTTSFTSLYDTIKFAWPQPGHIFVRTRAVSRFDCTGTAQNEYLNGHFATIHHMSDTVICVGDSVIFTPRVNYYDLMKNGGTGLNNTPYWQQPVTYRNGRTPLIPEEIMWDLDGDSIPDDFTYRPTFFYNQVGNYTVHLFTKDSAGCDWQVKKFTDLVKVVGVQAGFGIDSPGNFRVCAPHFFSFSDSSFVLSAGNDPLDSIVMWRWDFGDGTPPVIRIDTGGKNVSHVYTHNGTFTVTLTVFLSNAKHPYGGCVSSFSKDITIKGPTPRFRFLDSNVACAPATFTIRSDISDASFAQWDLGDGRQPVQKTGVDTVKFTYTKPGTYCLRLFAGDSIRTDNDSVYYCTDYYPFGNCDLRVTIHPPAPAGIVYDSLLCFGFNSGQSEWGVFTDDSDPQYNWYTLDFGDGNKESNSTGLFTHSYSDTGSYTITYTPTGAPCKDMLQRQVNVQGVRSLFSINPNLSDTPNFYFENKSENGVKFTWNFDDGTGDKHVAEHRDMIHTFQQKGILNVCLVAESSIGCRDTFCLPVELITLLKLYNVFTPNGDNHNDRFVIEIAGELKYDLQIYNRWGERVFRSDNRRHTWDGTYFNNGREAPSGTYFFVFRYRLLGDEKDKKVTGTVTLLRDD